MQFHSTTESRRGCGYRKGGGLYVVAGGPSQACGRFPIALGVCPTCHGGIKQTRGWTWIEPAPFFLEHDSDLGHFVPPCSLGGVTSGGLCSTCPVNAVNVLISAALRVEAGLLWIGEGFYKTPGEFLREGIAQGISRRISALPLDFVVGETRVFFAHAKAVPGYDDEIGEFVDGGKDMGPGIFASFVPSAIDYIVTDEEHDLALAADAICQDRGGQDAIKDDNLAEVLGTTIGNAVLKLRRLERRGVRLVRPTRVNEYGKVVDENGKELPDAPVPIDDACEVIESEEFGDMDYDAHNEEAQRAHDEMIDAQEREAIDGI